MPRTRILLQLDPDPQPSAFDAVVAVDAGAEQLFRHGAVTPRQVEGLVHGLMFTRGPEDLKSSAVFIGGSNIDEGERILESVRKCFFGPIRVSVLLDSGGSNTTAAAAVLSAAKHLSLSGARALVLGATGPVGRRVVRLLATSGAEAVVASRDASRAADVCQSVSGQITGAKLTPLGMGDLDALKPALQSVQLVISAGAAGVKLLPRSMWAKSGNLQVAVDLNAVPPAGIEGVDMMDKAKERDGILCYGAIGVGGLKMKIHKAAIQKLFERNDQILDADEIFAIGGSLGQ
jgi:hypothetical protein